MIAIHHAIRDALRGRERLVLATLVASSGSTPVPAGAAMLTREGDAMPVGTVGGGCVEGDVLEVSRRMLESGERSLLRRFILTEDHVESGMLCGGTIDILVEVIPESAEPLYSELCAREEAGEDSAIVTLLGPGGMVRKKVLVKPDGPFDPVPASVAEEVPGAIARQGVARIATGDGEAIIEPVLAPQEVIVFGGGHVGKSVSRSAALAGFRVTVIDDRPEFANRERFPEAARTIAVRFDLAWKELRIRPTTSIVIVTRGHKFDEGVLEEAVRTGARYVGMIGSRKKAAATFAHLKARGCPQDLLAKVHAPIGLSIGAMTAEEIGISITAELIAARRGVIGGAKGDRGCGPLSLSKE